METSKYSLTSPEIRSHANIQYHSKGILMFNFEISNKWEQNAKFTCDCEKNVSIGFRKKEFHCCFAVSKSNSRHK